MNMPELARFLGIVIGMFYGDVPLTVEN